MSAGPPAAHACRHAKRGSVCMQSIANADASLLQMYHFATIASMAANGTACAGYSSCEGCKGADFKARGAHEGAWQASDCSSREADVTEVPQGIQANSWAASPMSPSLTLRVAVGTMQQKVQDLPTCWGGRSSVSATDDGCGRGLALAL